MQLIDIYSDDVATNVANLKEALEQYASDYFTSFVQTDNDDGGGLSCYIDGTLAMEFLPTHSTPTSMLRVYAAHGEMNCKNIASCAFSEVLVTDSAIVIFPAANSTNVAASYKRPIVIYKTANGYTAVTFVTNNTQLCDISTSTSRVIENCVLTKGMFSRTFSTAVNDRNYVSAQPIISYDNSLSEGVFLVVDRSYHNYDYPFQYRVNDVSYVGIAYNTFIFRSE